MRQYATSRILYKSSACTWSLIIVATVHLSLLPPDHHHQLPLLYSTVLRAGFHLTPDLHSHHGPFYFLNSTWIYLAFGRELSQFLSFQLTLTPRGHGSLEGYWFWCNVSYANLAPRKDPPLRRFQSNPLVVLESKRNIWFSHY